MRFDFKKIAKRTLYELFQVELIDYLGRSKYEKTGLKSNHRNGYYGKKYTPKNIGELNFMMAHRELLKQPPGGYGVNWLVL